MWYSTKSSCKTISEIRAWNASYLAQDTSKKEASMFRKTIVHGWWKSAWKLFETMVSLA